MTLRARLRLIPAALALGAALTACLPEGNVDTTAVKVSVSGSTLTIEGWAWDPDTPNEPIDVHIYVDGEGLAVRADRPRPDVAASVAGAGPDHGYRAVVSVAPGSHEICVYGINAPRSPGDNTNLGCRKVKVTKPNPPSKPSSNPTTPTTKPSPTTSSTTPGGGGTTVPTTPTTPVDWDDDVLARVNEVRTGAGLEPLVRCSALDTAAQAYASTMADNAWFDETGPDGAEPWTRVSTYGGTSTGENLAYGHPTSAAVAQAMLESGTSERENLLRPEFTHLGLGRAQGDPDGAGPEPLSYYWVQELGAGGTC
ncbi:MAG TPA: CAP domain-containing protein [Acidimicrobiales bacterium]